MQHAVVIQPDKGLAELNKYLLDGWTVIHVCPMPSSPKIPVIPDTFGPKGASGHSPTCLVVIERKNEGDE